LDFISNYKFQIENFNATIVAMEVMHFESMYPDTAREKDIEKLALFIKEGASAQLLSIPGVGRGTVFGLLAHNKKVRIRHFGKEHNSLHFVLVNFSEIRNRPLYDATKFLFLALSDSLKERGMSAEYTKINKIFKEALSFGDELVLSQALKEATDYLTLERKLKLIMLFDRFEEYVPTVTSEFFANLRTLRTRAKYQFSVIFSLNRPLEDLLEPSTLSDYYEFVAGHIVYLPLYDNVTTDFRVSYIEKVTKKKLPPATISQVVKETGGVGKLVKLSIEALLSEKQVVDEKKLSQYLFSKRSIQGALGEICRSLTPSEQTALIERKYEDKSAITYLECVSILVSGRIQIPLFDQHISTHRAEQKNNIRQIVFDQSTNSIKSGDVVLSDQLTASEFKLLSFLLESQERIVTRDEIIAATWSDVKSTAGITDQAVDQLIFRLRRKIEEDPNNPTHLQTVKGRGFRFVS
jgi:DNA-binding winged helix-turn-helix (wHTH) protein